MLATTLNAALLDIQVLQAPHIAEADDAAMTRIETRMQESARTARAAFEQLEAPAAAAALDRFMALNDELIKLSRRNSDVKSLALSLGQKRMAAAECEDALAALHEALARHAFSATR
jgi:hypothetical protein